MKQRKRLAALIAVGLAAGMLSPAVSTAATKKKATTKTTKKPAATAAPATTAAPPAAAAAPAPAKSGGKAVWGLEAESSEGFLPSSSNCAISCYQVFTSMAERLFSVDDKGKVTPWLADSITPSADYKSYVIKIHPGIKFHNGEALNADAVKANMDDIACGSVTSSAFFALNDYSLLKGPAGLCKAGKLSSGIASDGNLTVTVTLANRWVSLASYFASGQTYMMAPAQIKSGDRNKPIGTGPFKFKEWVVGDHLTVVKNPDYWGKAANLDEITFRPIPDEGARIAQLQSGQLDFMQTSNMLTMGDLRDLAKAGKIKFSVGSPTFGEVSYDMLNNGVAPFNNKNCRLAAAYGQDVATLIKLRAPGAEPADGPFAPGSLGYLPDSGYPKFNLDTAKSFFGKCKADLGGGDVKFTMGTTSVPDNIQTLAIQKSMMEAVGFKVDTVNIEQQKFIGVALVGAYQWFQWRSHGGFDPDQQRIWWHNEMILLKDKDGKPAFNGTTPAINLTRVQDGTIDTAFDQIRGNSDPAVRKKAAESIDLAFGDNAYDLWRWRTVWGVGSCAKCGGYTGQKTPTGDGTQDFPTGLVADMAALTKG
jgi:peptide/nickel transport system substrate-binding protein